MTNSTIRTGAIKARIRHDSADAPLQLDLSPEAATALAYIADDFAREIVPNCDEARFLIAGSPAGRGGLTLPATCPRVRAVASACCRSGRTAMRGRCNVPARRSHCGPSRLRTAGALSWSQPLPQIRTKPRRRYAPVSAR